MNTDVLQGKWKQMKGSAKQQFGKLTDDDLEMIAGQRDKLIGKLQERYGYAREEAQKKADEWLSSSSQSGSSPQSGQHGQQQGGGQPQHHQPEHAGKR